MNDLSQIISDEIKKQYKSVRKFADELGIAQTTIVSAIKNGVKGTAYETVIKMCEKLNIELVNYNSHIVMTNDVIDLINMYNNLDEKGAHAVMAFASMEFNRSKGNDDYIIQAISKSNEITERKNSEPGMPEIVSTSNY
mgnify:CR=1 FL=1